MRSIIVAVVIFIAVWVAAFTLAVFIVELSFTADVERSLELVQSPKEKVDRCIRCHESPAVVCKVTAYSNDPISINVPRWRDGRTATNREARRGLVAADWSIFPPGTVLYIPGYGMAEVQDRGSAVKGHHIDLFMDSRREALEWGVRTVSVFVLSREGGACLRHRPLPSPKGDA